MSQINMTEEELRVLNDCLNNRVEPPEELLFKLFPGVAARIQQLGMFDYKELGKSKHPVLGYAGKRPEAVILEQVNGGNSAGQLRIIKSFANGKSEDWKNLIVRGDNLQFLKTCYLNQDPLIKDKVKGKVKLVYIDPPFGTGDEYGGGGGEMSYSAKLMGAEYIESLRERLIYLRELLHPEGSIYIRLDYHFGHYMKIIMDEIFGKDNFRNEIIINRTKKIFEGMTRFNTATDSLFFYTRQENYLFNGFKKPRKSQKWISMHSPGITWTEVDDKYIKFYSKETLHEKNGRFYSRGRVYQGCVILPPEGRHWTFTQSRMDDYIKQGRIRYNEKKATLEYLMSLDEIVDSNWTDIPGYSFQYGYPTENSEQLLERVINSSSDEGDLVLDCFAGSGTTAAVAEKLGRRWIVCDFGKHAIYTMQKRILNIADSKKLGPDVKKNEKYGQPPKPFCVVSAGAYDFSKIMNLRQNKDAYISFVLGLFSIMRDAKVDYSRKYKLANIYAEKDGHPVEIYPVWDDEYLKDVRIDEEYLKDIIDASGGKLKGDYYIIVPETCAVIDNTTLKNDNNETVNFRLLKFPYKVLEEISRHFQIKEKPVTQKDINRLIYSTSFYFNEEVEISVERIDGGFKIIRFHTNILDADKQPFQGLDGLAMILIDFDYDGKIFDIDASVNREQITEDNIAKINGITDNTHIIAIDRHGNESETTRIE